MSSKRICPICKRENDEGTVDLCSAAYKYVIEKIRRDHPKWVEKDGACPKCLEYYEKL